MSARDVDQTIVDRIYRGIYVDKEADIPGEHEPTHIYIIGPKTNRRLAIMMCPCDCGELIRLNLLPAENDFWAWDVAKWGEVTFAPAIRKTNNCKSFFFLRDGKVSWCEFPQVNLNPNNW